MRPICHILTLSAVLVVFALPARSQCVPQGDQVTYGLFNYWAAYVYSGTNFNVYQGITYEGNGASSDFDETFGGIYSALPFPVYNSCAVTPSNFSVRYKLQKSFTSGFYYITAGASDGYRLSMDGGATYVINSWVAQPYNTQTVLMNLNGSYNIVLEFFNGTSPHRVTFGSAPVVLPIRLMSFHGAIAPGHKVQLKWKTCEAVNFDHFTVQCSSDAASFSDVETINVTDGNNSAIQSYMYSTGYAGGGMRYYRLAMVSRDGSISYSPVVAVKLDAGGVRVYPTLVESGHVYVEGIVSSGAVKAELFDVSGRKMLEKRIASLNGREQLSLNQLSPGSYVMRVMDASQHLLEKQTLIVR